MEQLEKHRKPLRGGFFLGGRGSSQKLPNRTPLYTEVGYKKNLKPSRAMNGILRSVTTVYVIYKPSTVM